MKDLRAQLEADMERFLGAGGEVTHCAPEDSAMAHKLPRRTRQQAIAWQKKQTTLKYYSEKKYATDNTDISESRDDEF